MRLIDADALQRRICGAKCGCEYEDCWNEEGCVYDHFISNSHTINAVPVVRCRECKLHTSSAFYPDMLFCQEHGRYVDPDGYCYLGERKEGADNE